MNKKSEIEKQRIGANIKRLRETEKLSQCTLAKMIGMDNGDISKLENGKSNPTLETLIKIAEGLDVDISELFIPQTNPTYHSVQFD